MHKSQGFGSAPRRGPLPNYLEMVAGAPATVDLFDGIDLTWNRIPGGAAVGMSIARAIAAYRDTDPAASVPALLEALAALDTIERGPWVAQKKQELLEAIRMCTGLAAPSSTGPMAMPPPEAVFSRL